MDRKKIIFKAIASLMILVLSLTGCSHTEPLVENKASFTYWVSLPTSIEHRVASFNDVLMYKEREKESGVHIDFIHPDIGQSIEQFDLMLASEKLPDLIEYNWVNLYSGGPQKAIDDGIIIPLNDYIDKYAPNFKKAITDKNELSQIYQKGSKTDSGIYFAFPNFNVGNIRTFGGPLIRKDWLDELGLGVPETIDDWTKVLTAFKEQKGVETPFTSNYSRFATENSFNGAYGVGHRLYLDGNTVKYGPLEDGYKAYINQMYEWYAAGLIDPYYTTNTKDTMDAKMMDGSAGATFGNIGNCLGIYLKHMSKKNPDYNVVCAPYPVLDEGDRNDFYQLETDVFNSYLAISTDCENPEEVVKWIDYWYSDEGYMLMNFGVEGKTYNMVDGKPVYTDEILHNPENLSINETLSVHCRATGAAPGLRQAPEYLEQYYEYPQQVEGYKMWSENVDNARKKMLPDGLMPIGDEIDEILVLETNIETYVADMCLKFVTGEEPIENYDKFRETLKTSFNIDKYLEIRQNMYNRYMAR